MNENKLYIVKYSANEFDDLKYDSPEPIYYSLNKDTAKYFYNKKFNECQKAWSKFCQEHPELKNNDFHYFESTETSFTYSIDGRWFYEYMFDEAELDKDLRYHSY